MPLTIRPFEPADRLRWDTLWQGYQKFYAIEIPKDVSDATWARILDPAERQPTRPRRFGGDPKASGGVRAGAAR